MKRRYFLGAMGSAAVGATVIGRALAGSSEAPAGAKTGDAPSDVEVYTVEKTEAEWREQLSPEAFDVLRKAGTEAPGSSELNSVKADGDYICAGCDLPLFKSEWKYESGTGWPSFYEFVEGHLDFKTDYKLIWPRKEYHCARCGGHQGHVFDDGPKPSGKRYCNNGVALKFVPAGSGATG
ncbi:peptide-methionine (R)-S-oxide reductase MsrB [Salinisphaera dokdonensis]